MGLREAEVISVLQKIFTSTDPRIQVGIGDDAAVLKSADNIVHSTELYIEGIHFDLAYSPLPHLGYKLISAALSDLAAMNALPKQVTLGLGLSNRFSVEAVDELYAGIKTACEDYQIDLVGGDTTASPQGLIVSVTANGVVDSTQVVTRSNAKPNDVICVSGDFGGALMGLQSLEREKQVFLANPDMQPELDNKSYVVLRQLKPSARFDIIHELRELGVVPTSMIDSSDGLAAEILHLCEASGTGARIFEKNIPIDDETYLAATEFNLSPLTAALNGGEDYELIFTMKQSDYDKITLQEEISVIGYMCDKEEGTKLITKGGNTHNITAQGWNAFA